MRVESQEEGPFEGEEAPHTGQVQAFGVGRRLLVCDGESQEGDEGGHSHDREEHTDSDEELEAFEPRAPEVLQVHDVSDEGPERQNS